MIKPNFKQNIEKLVEHFGGQTATARALGLRSQGTVGDWISGRNNMSALTAMQAEMSSGRQFMAWELCEDCWKIERRIRKQVDQAARTKTSK